MFVCLLLAPTPLGLWGLKFCTELGFHPEMVIANIRAGHTQGGPKNGGPGISFRKWCVSGKSFKAKVEGRPQLSQLGPIRSRTSPWCPAASPGARGRSAAVVPWSISLKLGPFGDMATEMIRTPDPRVPGPYSWVHELQNFPLYWGLL